MRPEANEGEIFRKVFHILQCSIVKICFSPTSDNTPWIAEKLTSEILLDPIHIIHQSTCLTVGSESGGKDSSKECQSSFT